MPTSVASQRDPFRGEGSPRSGRRASEDDLRVPQARILQALTPPYPEDPPSEWPLLTRAQLGVRAGYTVTSGTVTRAVNGTRGGNGTTPPQVGLLARGLVEETSVDVDGVVETNYRITAAGVAALRAYLDAGGTVPPVKDPSRYTNDRYRPT